MSNNVHTIYTINDVNEMKKFKFLNENREVNNSHVNKIKTAMKNGEDVGNIEIELNSNFILDGQHRLNAAIQLNEVGVQCPIHVIYVDLNGNKEKMIDFIIKKNNTALKWKTMDYAKSRRLFNQDYQKLIQWADEHDLCHVTSKNGKVNVKINMAGYLLKGTAFNPSQITKDKFYLRNGEIEKANEVHEELKFLFNNIVNYTSENINRDRGAFIAAYRTYRYESETLDIIKKLPNGVQDMLDAFSVHNFTSARAAQVLYRHFDEALQDFILANNIQI